MQLLSCPEEPRGLSHAVLAETYNGNSLLLAHEDGVISAFDEDSNLVALFVNTGREVICMKVCDDKLLVAFSDCTLKAISLATGFCVYEAQTLFPICRISIFENYIACWTVSRNNDMNCTIEVKDSMEQMLLLLQRGSLEIYTHFTAESAVLDCFEDENGILLVCSYNIYICSSIDSKNSQSATEPEFYSVLADADQCPLVGGCSLNGALVLAYENSWKVCKLVRSSVPGVSSNIVLEEDMSVATPLPIQKLINTTKGIILSGESNDCLLICNNNMQLLHLPESICNNSANLFVTGNASLVSNQLQVFEHLVQNGEATWRPKPLSNIQISNVKYLPLQEDSKITAAYNNGTIVGYENGIVKTESTEFQAFPGMVTSISSTMVSSKYGVIQLPFSDFNAITQKKSVSGGNSINDNRIAIKICPYYSSSGWKGLAQSIHSFAMFNTKNGTPPHISVAEIAWSHNDIGSGIQNSPYCVPVLEELVVIYTEMVKSTQLNENCQNDKRDAHDKNIEEDQLLDISVKLLGRLWSAHRIEQLEHSSDMRALKILASAAPLYKFTPAFLNGKIALCESSGDLEAILWVFIYKPELTNSVLIPFKLLNLLSQTALQTFSTKMALYNKEKLVTDTELMCIPEKVQLDSIRMALTILHLSMLASPQFRFSESQLVHVVSVAVFAVKNRINEARSVLIELQSQGLIIFNKPTQTILIKTPETPGVAACIMDINLDASHILKLRCKPTESRCEDYQFSTDGKCVTAKSGTKTYTWQLYGGFMNLFKRTSGSLHPENE